VFVSSAVQAAVIGTWGGGSGTTTGNWSSLVAPGWTNGTVPNAQGDVAQYTVGTGQASSTTVNDVVGGVTVGTIKVDGSLNFSWQITPNNSVFLNEDGPGPLRASLINNIQATNAVTNVALFLNSTSTGTLVLQDDLLVSNTSNSARNTGSIQLRGKITGGGNITVENATNNIAAGQVAFTGEGAFGGNTTIAKGAATFTRGDIFSPNPANVVTIGSAGGGAATLAAVGNGLGNIENNFVAAAGSGGTLVFAANSTNGANPATAVPSTANITIKSTNTNAASIRLDGDLSFSNLNTAGSVFVIGDPITGVGKLTKIGAGPMLVTNTNSYQGGTVVDAGSLAVGHADAFNNGFGFYGATDGTLGSGDVTVNTTATRLEIEAGVAAINVISDIATVSLAGGGTLGTADNGYMLLGAGVNETIGMLLLNGIAQEIGTYGSTTSGATFQNDEFFSGPGVLNVTLVPEPASLSLLGFAAAGLLGRRRRA
jgi:autotransporter-associated beta strand protein